jgi:hypothetical protein
MTGYATCMDETKDLYRNFLCKPDGKRLMVDHIKMELKNRLQSCELD